MALQQGTIQWFNRFGDQVLKELCRHLVGIRWLHARRHPRAGEPTATRAYDPRTEFASAFLVAAGDYCLLITAGHRVSDLVSSNSNQRRVVKAHLHLGLHNERAGINVRLPLEELSCWYADDAVTGHDYATFLLPADIVSSVLDAGAVPMPDISWRSDLPKADLHVMLGFPREQRTKDRHVEAETTHEPMRFGTPLLPLEVIHNPEAYSLDAPLKRFCARIVSKFGHANGEPLVLLDIDGMSGGPILALKATTDGFLFQLVAVQSTWDGHENIAGCYVRPFLLKALNDIERLQPPQAHSPG